MPCDMAMEGPYAGVVGVDLDHDVAVTTQHLGIAALRVEWVGDRFAVPGTGAFGEDKLEGWGMVLVFFVFVFLRGGGKLDEKESIC